MSNPELVFASKTQEEETKSAVAARPSSEDPKGCPNITQSSNLLDFQDFQDLQRETASKPMGDNDGFKTPTSLKHKIPEMITCPPAPKKNQILITSTVKGSVIVFKNPRRSLQFDGSVYTRG
ncbi:cyclin-dependent protein kinase inhibitor SMR9-like [Ipomoea triloba]|uniref:cyclin-dependent protein kinase inhibitor SMR9-like n=1 Tax=Ipomoea triloba TaxID=35885 RepID=UPI00125D4EFD|nr:cyclin-dependent protein kinase inhibitor SMR9-like [Ipomoea triloba]